MDGYAARIRDNSFEAVLTVQFVYAPFDLVNYLAGFLRVGWKGFALATFLGSLPGICLFRAARILRQHEHEHRYNGPRSWAILASVAVFAGSIAAPRYFKMRDDDKEENDGSQTEA